MKEKQVTNEKTKEPMFHATQQEDAALKIMMQFFAEELLTYFGIEGEVASVAPTENVHLELKKLYEDFNLVMKDGTWKHFEFQSTNEGKKGLKRFRSYEAMGSYLYGAEITTYVLFSGTIKHPMTELTEGINTYRIVPIIMQDLDADRLIAELKEKVASGESITKSDLVQLTLCPLMGGEIQQKERITAAFEITKSAVDINPEERRKIEAVIYTMAEKFLDFTDMEAVREAISMTKLGQMLVNDGIEQGMERNKIENAKNLLDLLDEKTIAERIGLPLETVQKLKKESV